MGSLVGQKAPAFALQDQRGTLVNSEEFYGKQPLVLFFYPKDYTPICTLENIAFREAYSEIKKLGAEVLGISSDTSEKHSQFCDFLNLPFRLLADPKNQVRDSFGATGSFGRIAGRVTYVIDKQGIVRDECTSAFRPNEHVKKVLSALK